jgi:hypothetical protein
VLTYLSAGRGKRRKGNALHTPGDEASIRGDGAVVQHEPGKPDRQYSPDAVLAKQFGLGCGVLFLAFLLMTAAVWWFWTH